MSGFEVLVATAVAGTVLETVGGVIEAERDGKIARANAAIVQQEASEAARLEAADGRRMVSKALVRAASSGMSVDGSALDVIGELAAEGEYRARSAIYSGQTRYDNFRAEQKAAKGRKIAAIAGGVSKVGTTLLTSGMSLGAPSGGAAGAAGSGGGLGGSVSGAMSRVRGGL